MTKDEALKLALEALELHGEQYPHMVKGYCLDAIAAIKEALEQPDFEKIADDLQNICDKQALKLGHLEALLAQPEQEPVAWVVYSSAENDIVWADKGKQLKQNTPLYTHPPQRKPLTDEEIGAILEGVNAYGTRLYTFARAIEAKLKEKNT